MMEYIITGQSIRLEPASVRMKATAVSKETTLEVQVGKGRIKLQQAAPFVEAPGSQASQ